jgi:hypothetical protein
MTDWLATLPDHFTAADYVAWSRIQATAWTAVDFVLILGLLQLSNTARPHFGRRRHVASYAILFLTLLPALALPFVPHGLALFRLELAITVPHFLLILYLIASDWKVVNQVIALIRNRNAS